MINIITAILILISSVASVYYAFSGAIKPENAVVYNKTKMPRLGIQLLSLFLGTGGLLLLFPLTFKIGRTMLIMHSLTTIICFIIAKDWRGGVFEFIFLQIPIFMLWAGYPFSIIQKLKEAL